jgi:Zn-dependent protease with chaperone function
VRCPACRAGIDVPAAPVSSSAAAVPSGILVRERVQTARDEPHYVRGAGAKDRMVEIINGFEGEIERAPIAVHYRLGLCIVTGAMLLLPLVYLGLIVCVIALVVVHATITGPMLFGARNHWVILFGYVAPLVSGVILVFFMIKPLFARPNRYRKLRSLNVHEAPLLFGLVSRIADAVGAPEPGRIDIDCEVNASASFGTGLTGLFGNDLVLTIGLPLLADLTVQQLAGVIAHELGHFSQSAGMRLSYIIRSINMWFARVALERDSWDDYLVTASVELGRLSLIFLLARLFVFLTRCALYLLMLVGHSLSSFLLRQMEFDADRHEIRLVGSQCFEETMRAISVLNLAVEGAFDQVIQCFQGGKLPDDLTILIVAETKSLPTEKLKRMEQELESGQTGLFDTHPCHAERLNSAWREDSPGIFHLDWPASELISNFPKTSRATTRDFLRLLFGKGNYKRATIISAASLVAGGTSASGDSAE